MRFNIDNDVIACPFKTPVETSATFGGLSVASRRFDQREGLSFSAYRFKAECDDEFHIWPFESFSQIIFVLRGKIDFSLPDIGRKTVRAGDWFIISLNSWKAISAFSGDVELAVIECSSEIWRSLATEQDLLLHTQKACLGCAQRLEVIFLENAMAPAMREQVLELSRINGATPRERLMIEAKTLELLAIAADESALNGSPKPEPCLREEDQDSLEMAASYLENNLSAPHSLATLSRQVALNEFKLKKGFRERYKTTVFGYLRQRRMERAKELLIGGNCAVIEAASAVGYSNPSHFARAFRQAFGLNPKELAARSRR